MNIFRYIFGIINESIDFKATETPENSKNIFTFVDSGINSINENTSKTQEVVVFNKKVGVGHKTFVRNSKKYLTTCNHCGHYRFARNNTKTVINSAFPYEHSVKGGCYVQRKDFIPAGQRFRRKCLCGHCIEAAKLFKHSPPSIKKKNQYHYNRTAAQKLVWIEMKTKGWKCRAGRYFKPGEAYSVMGGIEEEMFFRYVDTYSNQ